jgi:hypothetical protein
MSSDYFHESNSLNLNEKVASNINLREQDNERTSTSLLRFVKTINLIIVNNSDQINKNNKRQK